MNQMKTYSGSGMTREHLTANGWVETPQGFVKGKSQPNNEATLRAVEFMPKPVKKRIRQSQKPVLNKLETAFKEYLQNDPGVVNVHAQAQRFELARGLWYKPDFTCIKYGKAIAYEVKGPHAFRGGFENLKMAARAFPEMDWVLVWKDSTDQWCQQQILP